MVADAELRRALAAQTARARAHPVLFGSAITGAGVAGADDGDRRAAPAPGQATPDARVGGTVFKIERGASGEKIAYVRMRSGTLRARDRLQPAEAARAR